MSSDLTREWIEDRFSMIAQYNLMIEQMVVDCIPNEEAAANAKLIANAPVNINEHEKLILAAESLLHWMAQYRPITMTAEKQAVNRLKQQIEKSKQAIKNL